MKLWFERGAWASAKGRRKAAALRHDDIKSIAVIRHAALGDMVLVRPFLVELRKNFPNATITLSVVSNYTYGTPEDLVDRVHVIHGSDQRNAPLGEKIRRIRELGYHDLMFDLAATSRSFWTCMLNPAGLKVGFPYRALQRHLLYDVAILRTDFKFETDVMLNMLYLLGCKTDYPPNYQLEVEPLKRKRPYFLYFPSASTLEKCWPEENFATLVRDTATKYPQYDHLVLEGKEDWESIDGLMARIGPVENVEGIKPMPLEDVMRLIKGASFMVSNDTGIRNLAIALQVPTVGIFFDSVSPYRYWPRYGPHEVVHMPDGSIPPVSEVAETLDNLVSKANS